MLFADCFDHKDTAIATQVEQLKKRFEQLFAQQVRNLKLNETGQHLLASAWYTICKDQQFVVNNKPLLGLPWVISNKMCDLARFVQEQESVYGEGPKFRVTIKDGKLHQENIETRQISSNSAEEFDISFEFKEIAFKSWQERKDQYRHFSYRNTSRTTHQSFTNKETLRLVNELIVRLFKQIHSELYKYKNKSEISIFWNNTFFKQFDFIRSIVEVSFDSHFLYKGAQFNVSLCLNFTEN